MSAGKSPPPCPLPLALQHLRPPTSTPRPSPESLLLLLQARCIPPLPPSIPGSRSPPGPGHSISHSLRLALAGVGQLRPGGAWGEGGEQGRGRCQCYFEPLTGAASERRLLALGCSGPGHAGECPCDPPPRKRPRLLTLFPHLGKEGPFCRFPRCG